MEKAEKALEDAEVAALKSSTRSPCLCLLVPGHREEIRVAKLRVRLAERHYQRVVSERAERVKHLDRLQHDWLLRHGAEEPSSDQKVDKLVRTLSTTSPSSEDPWESQKIQAPPRPEGLREKAARHYGHCDFTGNSVIAKCCLTGIIGDRKMVTNAHLLPRNAPAHFLEELGIDDVDDVRNMVILCQNVEKLFEQKRLCFLLDDDEPGCFVLKIWDEKVKNKPLFDGDPLADRQNIGTYSGHKMRFAQGKTPFTRALSLHAQCSYETAKKNKWIDADEPKPDKYGSPLQDDILSFRDIAAQHSTDTTLGISTLSGNWDSPCELEGGNGHP